MADERFYDRIDQGAGKAKEWTGRATGDRHLEREGRAQSGLAGAKIKLRGVVHKIVRAFRPPRGSRRY